MEEKALELSNKCLYYCYKIKRHNMTNLCDLSIYDEIIENILDVYNNEIDITNCGIEDIDGNELTEIFVDYYDGDYFVSVTNSEDETAPLADMVDEEGIAKLAEYLTNMVKTYYDQIYSQK